MREIKFRAWTHKGFIYRELPHNGFMATPMAGTPQPRDWQQYTGLKDKNGVEIYEGDILSCGRGFVEFDDGCYWLSEGSLKLSEMNSHWEVIGNIYENPELLPK